MSSDFDPYYLWLGIPPHEQPPHHYRLLGIALFESNPSVIDSAASRQSTYLHSVATGPQRQASQKLLTEIAAARRTLLNAELKQAYDTELKARLESMTVKRVAPPIARPVAIPIATPVALPIAAPIAATVVSPEPAPLENLFGFSEEVTANQVDLKPPPARASVPSPKSPAADGSKSARFADRRIWIFASGASALVLILAFVLWPRGDDAKAAARSKKTTTAKKSPAVEPSKKSKSSATVPPQPNPQSSASSDSAASDKRKLIRFIRIELPRKGVLTLAEVEAFTDGRNVAGYGLAEQKNTANGAVAARAIDGNRSGKFADKGQTHTEQTDNPWWQLDLGGAYPLDKIVIHNRTDPGTSEQLAGFTLLLLDNSRRKILELKNQPAPAPQSEFVVKTLTATASASVIAGPTNSKPKPKSQSKPPAK